jgi:hypothetical protein
MRESFGKTVLGDSVASFTDKNGDENAEGSESVHAGQLQDPNRRRFSRSALTGSAVVLSLGNRSAWGQTVDCMSVTTINSFDPTTGMFASAPTGRPDHNEDLAAEIHRISLPPDYLGTDGVFSTCQDPQALDGVCLVKGDCPP